MIHDFCRLASALALAGTCLEEEVVVVAVLLGYLIGCLGGIYLIDIGGCRREKILWMEECL